MKVAETITCEGCGDAVGHFLTDEVKYFSNKPEERKKVIDYLKGNHKKNCFSPVKVSAK